MNPKQYLRFLLIVIWLLPVSLKAQNNKNIGIGTSNPDPSAILDISSSDKGVLVPRLTSAQITGINAPVEGLMVYNLDSACYFYYNKFQWVSLCHPGTASNGVHVAIVNGRTDVQLGGTLLQNTDVPLAGKKLTFSTTTSGGNVGIGNNNPDASAILDLSNSNNTGILIPKVALTKTSVAAPVTTPATGLMIFNTNTQNNVTPGYYFWDGTQWMRIFSTNLPVVSTVSTTAPIVNNGTAQDPNIGITTSDLKGSSVVTVNNGVNVLAGGTSADIDVTGTAGGVLYGTGASSSFTPAGTAGQYLQSQASGAPVWATGSNVLGSTVVNVANGTGQAVGNGNVGIDVMGPAGTLLYGTGASSAFTVQGTPGYLLQSNGVGAPTWVNPNSALVVSDLLGSSVLSVTNGAGKTVGAGNVNLDVVGANGGVMYGTGASSAFTPAGTSGQVLRSTGAGAPVWSSPNAVLSTNDVTGSSVINVSNGNGQIVGGVNMGIDVAGPTGTVLYGTGASSSFTGVGTAGQVLTSNGAGAPTWSNLPPSLAASNGLHVSATPDVQLGGSLTSNTSITQSGFSLSSSGGTINLNDNANNNVNVATGTSTGAVNIANGASAGTVQIGKSNTITVSNLKVGINNPGASEALDVTGNVRFSGALMPANQAGTSGQVLKSNGAATAPTWVSANSTLTTSSITGVGPITITNGANQTVGASNPSVDIRGTSGGVLYGTGAATSATFSAAGTSGQYLKSTGAGSPTWVNPVAKFSVRGPGVGIAGAAGNYYMPVNNYNVYYTQTTPASILYVYACSGYSIGYVANSTQVFSGASGTVECTTAGRVITVSVYKYSIVQGSTANLVGTLLSSGSVTCSVASGNYTFNVPSSATTINAGDWIVMYYSINAAGTFYIEGDMEFAASVQ